MQATETETLTKVIPARSRKIKKVAVLGSGVMGSRLAAHFANIGLQVILLDIVPFDLSDEQKEVPALRNRLVNESLKQALKSNPSPIYKKEFANRIKTGNFDDNMNWISDCDWILEAVIERLDIKREIFDKVEEFRKPGSMMSSNTSGIPIELMLEGRSEDFKSHFVGTHFFNPPRYLKLLEIIPSTQTHPEIIDFFMHYGDLFLGKTTVLCKDTPAFIANRIGVFSIMAIFHLMEEMNMTIEEVDALTGPVSGRPKSATFRTCDVVGIDTMVKVATGVYENCPKDAERDIFKIPDYVTKLVENKWLGDKTGQGFYKKTKDADGKRVIMALNTKTFEYGTKQTVRFESVGAARAIDDPKGRIKVLFAGKDKGAEFLRKLFFHLYQYVSARVPEISDEIYRIDDAMKTGFGWELGPFEQWDVTGLEETVDQMKEAGFTPAPWVTTMINDGVSSFYTIENGVRKYYDIREKAYKEIPGKSSFIILDNLRNQAPVWKNSGCILHDIGDGILNLEFRTKMNTIGGEVLEGINQSIAIAEKDYRGLVLGNDAPNFSAGANLAMILMMAIEQEYDELDFAIRAFQNTVMRVRYSGIPVVVAPHGLSLGGGCEITLHSDSAVAAAETYIGLVEVGVGVIPGGGGTKEMVLRASDSFTDNDTQLPKLQDRFINIATAKVATSAHEAFSLGILDHDKDSVVLNSDRLIAESKRKAIDLYEAGYTQPVQRDDVLVLGRTALGGLYAGAASFNVAKYATDHDMLIAQKLAYVMAGGDLSQPTKVSEQYLLDLERQAFLSLCGERKTLERMQHLLKTGKPLRN